MYEVAGSGQAKLRIFFVVAGVGEIVRVADFLQARILDAAVFLVVGFWRKNGCGTAREMNSIITLRIAQA